MKPVVQLSLDLTNIPEAVSTAEIALSAGVDWLEVGTPLIISDGMGAVKALRALYPDIPLVADLKTMDGGWLEAELMAKAGATHVVVMGVAHEETIELVVKAGKDLGVKVMGDNMAMPDPVDGARKLEDMGCDYIIHHVGFDYRTLRRQRGLDAPSPLEHLEAIVDAVGIPVQAVGGLTIEQAIKTPAYGAPLVVIGAPLAIDAHSFKTADGDLKAILQEICSQVHAYPDVPITPRKH
ncbi:MAG: orotidine 5'-phosphate decarboxylase [Rhodothermaceae bacterium]|nr:orotidine 5'-phosphate decarboxylase [Rhodothermaceae bacterium]